MGRIRILSSRGTRKIILVGLCQRRPRIVKLLPHVYIDFGVGELINLLDLQGSIFVSDVNDVDGLAASVHVERVIGLVGRLRKAC